MLPAEASADILYCSATKHSSNKSYVTAFIDIGSDKEARRDIDAAFEKYLRANDPADENWSSSCDQEPSLSRLEDRLDYAKYNSPNLEWLETGWTGGYALASKATPAPRRPAPPQPAIVLEPSAPVGATAKQQAALLEASREEAGRQVQALARAQKSADEEKAAMERLRAWMRKQGSRQ
ncbi:hypothetical protein D3876_07160 [Sphingomonas cavernae]|uniref:Uncharacterized protein n=2 Tax=Sphingomonas cavernae TaxID=2320861 RepID=A0A418WS08_9SPHN|nr:hypothetical protein D3876_07160 [Sphingomonas cavernae]